MRDVKANLIDTALLAVPFTAIMAAVDWLDRELKRPTYYATTLLVSAGLYFMLNAIRRR